MPYTWTKLSSLRVFDQMLLGTAAKSWYTSESGWERKKLQSFILKSLNSPLLCWVLEMWRGLHTALALPLLLVK